MKLGQLKQLLKEIVQHILTESADLKFLWLDPNGKLIQVKPFGHADWAADFLKKNKQQIPNQDIDVYSAMAKLHYYRVVFFVWQGVRTVEYDFLKGNPPSNAQMRTLKDFAIEMQAEKLSKNVF